MLQSKAILMFTGLVVALFSFTTVSNKTTTAVILTTFTPNDPIGEAKGVNPGRVAWIHNTNATNEELTNTYDDYWFMDKNTNQAVLDTMLTEGICDLTGQSNLVAAWDTIFKYFNYQHGKGYVGYTPGEKFAVKINLTNSCCRDSSEMMDTSPQMVLALLKQLVDVLNVPQSDIYIGDNYRKFRTEYYNRCKGRYPNVNYLCSPPNYTGATQTSNRPLKFSNNVGTSTLPQAYVNATYLINMACLKSHDHGGITLCAKNHQGSVSDPGAAHNYLPKNSSGDKQYRRLVDYMGHKDLGGKTLLYLVEGIWAGKNWDGVVEKWQMAPFNNDYPNSLFLSQDAVAIESVGFDFLLAEYIAKPDTEKYPYMAGVEDYIKQAADNSYWPEDITYDPEGDGTAIGSLGVYEHWNNATDKQYSRNLNSGNGIELTYNLKWHNSLTSVGLDQNTKLQLAVYPNPFCQTLSINTFGSNSKPVFAQIYNLRGVKVFETVLYEKNNTINLSQLTAGNYVLKISEKKSGKFILSKIITRVN